MITLNVQGMTTNKSEAKICQRKYKNETIVWLEQRREKIRMKFQADCTWHFKELKMKAH